MIFILLLTVQMGRSLQTEGKKIKRIVHTSIFRYKALGDELTIPDWQLRNMLCDQDELEFLTENGSAVFDLIDNPVTMEHEYRVVAEMTEEEWAYYYMRFK